MINGVERSGTIRNGQERSGTVGNGGKRWETVRDDEGLWCHDGVTMMDYG